MGYYVSIRLSVGVAQQHGFGPPALYIVAVSIRLSVGVAQQPKVAGIKLTKTELFQSVFQSE